MKIKETWNPQKYIGAFYLISFSLFFVSFFYLIFHTSIFSVPNSIKNPKAYVFSMDSNGDINIKIRGEKE